MPEKNQHNEPAMPPSNISNHKQTENTQQSSQMYSKKDVIWNKFIQHLRYQFSFHRHQIRYIMLATVILIGLLLWLIWFTHGRHIVQTEDAYVEGNVVTITPQISGNVVYIGADNTDTIEAGQVLVRLDPTDAELILSKAKLSLAQAARNLRYQFATRDQLKDSVVIRQSELTKAEADYKRRVSLSRSNAVSTEELQLAKQRYDGALAAYHAAQSELAGEQALIGNTQIETHPNIANASIAVREAYLTLQRTTLISPVSGMVTKRNAQIGQHVTTGATMMSVVPLQHLWVSANFKESQLKNIRTGQPVELIADIYGKKIKYNGEVIGLDAGTGSAFALLPAQNATGNWIKIIQRLPVRIKLDKEQIAQYPLRIGLSMKVTIDTRNSPKNSDNKQTVASQNYETTIFEYDFTDIDTEIANIIKQNTQTSESLSQQE